MSEPLFKESHFLLFDFELIKKNLEPIREQYNTYFKPTIKDRDLVYKFMDMGVLITELFLNILNQKKFTEDKWEEPIKLIKFYHDNYLNKIQELGKKLSEIKTDFIKDFIKKNFIIINKEKKVITDTPIKWINADKIKPFGIFYEIPELFNVYHNIKNIPENTGSSYTQNNSFFDEIYNIYKKQNKEHISKPLLKEVNYKMDNVRHNLNYLEQKISVIKKLYEYTSTKDKKNLSLSAMVDLIHKENIFKKEILNTKQDLQYGILHILHNVKFNNTNENILSPDTNNLDEDLDDKKE